MVPIHSTDTFMRLSLIAISGYWYSSYELWLDSLPLSPSLWLALRKIKLPRRMWNVECRIWDGGLQVYFLLSFPGGAWTRNSGVSPDSVSTHTSDHEGSGWLVVYSRWPFFFEWDNGRMDVEMLEERKGGVWDAEDGGLVEQEGERVEVEEMLVGLIGILQMAIGDQICR